VYANNSLTLVYFDLGQIYNSNKYLDTSDLCCVLPIAMVAAYRNGNNLVAPVDGSAMLCSIKTNFLNLIHQGDLLGFAPTGLDSVKRMKFNDTAEATGTSGNGLTDNRFIGTGENQIAISTAQNTGVGNTGTQYKIGRYIGMTDETSTDNNIAAIVSTQNLDAEYRPYHVSSGNYMIWYDFAVIRLSHLFESLGKFGLLHRLDASIRLWVNTGTVNVTVTNPNSNTNNLAYSLTTVNNTFSNTCSLMINYLPGTSATGGIPDTVNGIVAGFYIVRPPTTSFNNVNLSLSAAAHPLLNCRLYYSQIEVKPVLGTKYSLENTV
jgi:hypothetical protein